MKYIYIFIDLSVHGHVDRFHVLAIVNIAAMNIGVHVSFQIQIFVFSRYVPRREIAQSNANSIFREFFWPCLASHGMLVPQPGIEPTSHPLHWKAKS